MKAKYQKKRFADNERLSGEGRVTESRGNFAWLFEAATRGGIDNFRRRSHLDEPPAKPA